MWLVPTFINVETVTEDVEIGPYVSWQTRGLDSVLNEFNAYHWGMQIIRTLSLIFTIYKY
jgi:hypothetical protein